jgi:inositol-hexakisphosphate kinase
MLVTYRRVFKGSLTPTYSDTPTPHPSSAHQPHPDFHKFASHLPQGLTLSTKFSEEDPMSGHESSEEMPEVVLDRNRHLVPEWVLRLGGRKRDRSMSHSHSPPYHRSPDTARHLKSMCAMTASTPDLMRRESSGTSMKCSPLTRQDTIPLEEGEAPTPSNSPERPLPSSSFSDPRSAHCMLAQEGHRPDLRLFHSEMSIGQQQGTPSWFGGTGSTMVNTKLKDHVFNTILRRFQRQHHGKWSSSSPRVDDEGEMADHEGRLIDSGRRIRSDHRKRPVGHSESVKRNKGTSRSPSVIRRVQSESAMDTKDAQEWTTCMGYDTLQDIMSQPQGFHQDQLVVPSDTMRRRSRSRSVDFPTPTMRRSSEPVPSKPSSVINSDDSITRQNHFIFMEDLTGRLKRSCVLDLKMGTRQYGMDATLAKKKSQRKKCDRTTSRPLGIRVCGMQVSRKGS